MDESQGSAADFDDALARAFAQIESAKKDKQNPHFKSSYADLAAVTDAVKGPLTAEGFSWPQTIAMDDGMVVVTTHLRRKGVELCSVLPMPIGPKATPQAVGSAITYARRYALSALVGVAPDDDDGNAASAGGGGSVRAPRNSEQTRPKPDPEVTKARKEFQALSRKRGDLIQENRLEGLMPAAALVAKALGCDGDTPPPSAGYTAEDWGMVSAAFRESIASIEGLLAADGDA